MQDTRMFRIKSSLWLFALPCLAAVLSAPSVRAAASDEPVAHAAERDPRYRLQPMDQIQIEYRYSPEYNQLITIQPDGFATLTLIGDVKLENLTMDAARSLILDRLRTRLNDPEITLTLVEFVKPTFTVTGHVASPGRFDLRGNVSAIEAIAIAGGFKSDAKHSQVILFRHVGDMAETHMLDLKKMMDPSHPHMEEAITVRPGDVLFVPQNRISKMMPYLHWIGIGTYFPL